MSYLNQIFQKVFVINLDRSPERLLEIDKKLKALNINYERISAVDGKTLGSEEIKQMTTAMCARGCTLSSIGCAMSHINVWKQIIRENLTSALVLEDDAIFSNNFEQRFKQSWAKVPNNWDLVYVGCSAGCGDRANYTIADWLWVSFSSIWSDTRIKLSTDVNEDICTPDFAAGTHCYALSNTGARKLAKALQRISLTGHIDVLMSYSKELKNTLAQYAFKDYDLVTQPLSASSSTIGSGGSPYLGNWLMDKVYLNKRGIQGGWILSETNFRLRKTEYGGWELICLITGFITSYLIKKRNPKKIILIFTTALVADQMLFGNFKKWNVPQTIVRISLFAVGLYGGKRIN